MGVLHLFDERDGCLKVVTFLPVIRSSFPWIASWTFIFADLTSLLIFRPRSLSIPCLTDTIFRRLLPGILQQQPQRHITLVLQQPVGGTEGYVMPRPVSKTVPIRTNASVWFRYLGKSCLDCTNASAWSGIVVKGPVTFFVTFLTIRLWYIHPLPILIFLWNDLPDLAVAFYCVVIKLPDRLFSLGG